MARLKLLHSSSGSSWSKHSKDKDKQKDDNKRKKSKHDAGVPPTSTVTKIEKKAEHDVNFSTSSMDMDPAVAHLSIIPKLLFEGMVNEKAATVESAVEYLADMFRLSSDKRIESYQAGGHTVLVVTMTKWVANESIQTSSCRCIQNMTCTNAHAKESFAIVGGLEAVVTAMRSFPTSQRVQRSGCGAVMNLLSGHEDEGSHILTNMATRFVNDYDGIALVVKAMQEFPEEVKIQLWGNGLFQNLATHPEFRLPLMKSGAITATGGSLELYSDHELIRQYASKFLKVMFS